MNGFRSQRIGSESGYTLIELLAVMSILLILSLFSVPVMDTLTDRARLATSLQDMRVIEQALEAYHVRNGRYPDQLSNLISEGYLGKDFTFKSPWAAEKENRYFFYAVDNVALPRAYFLADPGPADCSETTTLKKTTGSPIPCGASPYANAISFVEATGLKTKTTLSGWRETCDPRDPKHSEHPFWCVVKTES